MIKQFSVPFDIDFFSASECNGTDWFLSNDAPIHLDIQRGTDESLIIGGKYLFTTDNQVYLIDAPAPLEFSLQLLTSIRAGGIDPLFFYSSYGDGFVDCMNTTSEFQQLDERTQERVREFFDVVHGMKVTNPRGPANYDDI